MQKQKKELEKGITLITLVVTIVVLLIIAAVALAVLDGENGIIAKVQESKIESVKAEEKEKIKLAINGTIDENYNGKVNGEKFKETIEKELGEEVEFTDNGGSYFVKFKETERTYTITEDGEILEGEVRNIPTLKLDLQNINLKPGETATIKAVTNLPESLTWTSSNSGIVQIPSGSNGNTTLNITAGETEGSCIITAEVQVTDEEGKVTIKTAKCTINVAKERISPTEITIALTGSEVIDLSTSSKTRQVTATITPAEANTNTEITWSSSNPEVASVSGSGNTATITGKTNGSATITATTGNGVSTSCSIVCQTSITEISLNTENEQLKVGDTLELIATINPSNTTEELVWTTSNDGVIDLTENGTKATIRAKGSGTVTITAKNSTGTINKTCTIMCVKVCTAELELTEIGDKGVKLTLNVDKDTGRECTYKAYVNGELVKTETTAESEIEVYNRETFFDIGIKEENTYAEVEYYGQRVETNHVAKEDLKIKYKEELKALSTNVNSGNTYSGKTITQIADIDLQGSESNQWVAIGTETNQFEGIYNGSNHTISNIYINTTLAYQGLFGYNKGTIKNLGIVSGTLNFSDCSGAIVGINNSGTIEKCYNKVNITGNNIYENIAAICGRLNGGTISKCYNIGNITGTVSSNYTGTCGIVGYSYDGIIEECYNGGNITTITNYDTSVDGNNRACGIVNEIPNSIVRACYNTGIIKMISKIATDVTPVASGIVGQNPGNGTIENCYNVGNIIIEEQSTHGSWTNINGDTFTAATARRVGICGCIHSETNYTIRNNYYLSGTASWEVGDNTGGGFDAYVGNSMTSEQMKNLASTLGASFKNDVDNINNGYPILNWQ